MVHAFDPKESVIVNDRGVNGSAPHRLECTLYYIYRREICTPAASRLVYWVDGISVSHVYAVLETPALLLPLLLLLNIYQPIGVSKLERFSFSL